MPAVQPLCLLLDIDPHKIFDKELLLFEANFFVLLCEEINSIAQLKNSYVQFLREKIMVESNLIRFILNDILCSQEYNIPGIALYTHSPEDVIHDLVSGFNANPSLELSRKIIELHRITRPNLYKEIANKIKQKWICTT